MIMEPPRHAWVSLAAWSSPGCASDPGPPSQSADLRAYYAKHTKIHPRHDATAVALL